MHLQPLPERLVQRLQEQDPRPVTRRHAQERPPPRQDNSVRRDLSHDEPPRSQNNRGRGGRGRPRGRGRGQGRGGRGGIQRQSQGSANLQHQEERLIRIEEMLERLQNQQAAAPPVVAPPTPQDAGVRIPGPGEQMAYSQATAAIVERIRRHGAGLPPSS